MLKATLIVSFYKKIEYLKLLFSGLESQSINDFEVIIADDGSSPDIIDKIQKLLTNSNINSKHIWHEDKGFRKNKILNKAIQVSLTDYLIFIDGDCVPHPKFIEEHIINSAKGVCLTGRRVNLSEKFTKKLTTDKIKSGYIQSKFHKIIIDGIVGKSFDVEKGFYFNSEIFRRYFNKKKRGVLGCNFSLYKNDMLRINGFDERYEAPSIGEDSDIEFRLDLTGVEIKSLNNVAVQYHLYHKLLPRPQINADLFEKVKKEKIAFTKFGIEKHIIKPK